MRTKRSSCAKGATELLDFDAMSSLEQVAFRRLDVKAANDHEGGVPPNDAAQPQTSQPAPPDEATSEGRACVVCMETRDIYLYEQMLRVFKQRMHALEAAVKARIWACKF